uniref:Uncharacterized protein n=1 Tax=Romanomermis culicivorax TaxID=13658 RepID=A0A915J4B4_ROMCU
MAIFLRLMITSSWNHSLRKILAVLDDGVKHHSNVIRSAETSTFRTPMAGLALMRAGAFVFKAQPICKKQELKKRNTPYRVSQKLTCFVPSLTMRIVTVHLSMNGALNQTRSRGSLNKSPGAVELRIDMATDRCFGYSTDEEECGRQANECTTTISQNYTVMYIEDLRFKSVNIREI